MFEGFLGNEELKRNVEKLLETGRLPHAVTVCGRKGCGAGCFAKLLAAAYLSDRNGLVERGVHPDFIELSGEGPSGEIRIESVREDLYEISMASVMADGRRVIYIRHAGDLNESSANALLKAMEEPGPGVLFLLTAEEPGELMETIRSRTAFYYVLPLDEETCAAETVRRVPSCSEEDARKLSRVFGGRLGSALNVLRDKQASESFRAAENFCVSALKGRRYDCMVWAASRIESREDYRAFLEICAQYCGCLLREEPERAERVSRISEAVGEAYATANSVNLKLSAARLAAASIR